MKYNTGTACHFPLAEQAVQRSAYACFVIDFTSSPSRLQQVPVRCN